MEENNPAEEKSVQDQKIVSSPPPSTQESFIASTPPSSTNPPKKKTNKLLIIFFVILGILSLFFILASPIMKLLNINPEAKFAEATLKACTEECSSSKDSACINKCMEASGLRGMVTPAKITSILTPTATPSPTVTVVKKITYAPKASPTPSTSDVSLTIEIGIFGPDSKLLPPSDYHTITIQNSTTGKTQIETRQNQVLTYYNLDPGAYKITVSSVAGKAAASYYCYNCSAQKRGTLEGYSDDKSTVDVNLKDGIPVTVWFVYHNL